MKFEGFAFGQWNFGGRISAGTLSQPIDEATHVFRSSAIFLRQSKLQRVAKEKSVWIQTVSNPSIHNWGEGQTITSYS